MTRKKIIAGNWKMNLSPAEAKTYFSDISKTLKPVRSQNHRVIFPIAYCLNEELKNAASLSGIELGAQNLHWEDKGAFTGELSGAHLKAMAIQWVLIAHSERRQLFSETDETAYKRTLQAIKQGLNFIFCLGETLAEREAGKTFEVLKRQTAFFAKAVKEQKPTAIASIAYEPVWAIGTGKTATVEQAEEAHHYIRNELKSVLDSSFADQTSILYGGSVNTQNAKSLLEQKNIDGLLIGGASLKPQDFSAISLLIS